MHQPVLLKEAVEALSIAPDGFYIDGTYGRGGHSAAILKHITTGRLLVIDKDPSAIAEAHKRFDGDDRVIICHGSFADMLEFAKEANWVGRVDGVLLDLGVSSPQLDEAERGFSFLRDGPLDMRMNTSQEIDATKYVATVSEEELTRVLKEYGEERFAKRIARAILKAREEAPITTTKKLAGIIADANPAWEKHKHPATRGFQAIRIAINDELGDIQAVLKASLDVLKPGGRLAVISFHSLEDRLVKRFLQRQSRGRDLPRGLPLAEALIDKDKTFKLVGKAIKPSEDEIKENTRARSSMLRVAERLGGES
jgi:16S rRNA (cytosine1402-N4)-methyltransferase